MHGEEEGGHAGAGRDGGGAPGRMRRLEESAPDEVEARGAGGVEEQVEQVVADRLESAQDVVEAEAHPGQWNPVAQHGAGPHPLELREAETVDTRVLDDRVIVVPVDEICLERREKRYEGR